jgi:hypothetical protein
MNDLLNFNFEKLVNFIKDNLSIIDYRLNVTIRDVNTGLEYKCSGSRHLIIPKNFIDINELCYNGVRDILNSFFSKDIHITGLHKSHNYGIVWMNFKFVQI